MSSPTTVSGVVISRARVGEVGPLAAEYRRDPGRDGTVDAEPLPHDGIYWLARDAAGEALGYAAGTLRPEGFVLGPFFVRPANRRAGVGRLLLETVQRWAEDEQVPLLEVSVRTGNAAGLAFLEAAGYRPSRVLLARPTLSTEREETT